VHAGDVALGHLGAHLEPRQVGDAEERLGRAAHRDAFADLLELPEHGAAEGRPDRAVVDHRLGLLERGGVAPVRRLGAVEVARRHDGGGAERAQATEVGVPVGHACGGLVDPRDEVAVLELDDGRVGLDHVAFLVGDADDAARDLRGHVRFAPALDPAGGDDARRARLGRGGRRPGLDADALARRRDEEGASR
jgi:hypothetical protein